MSWIYKAEKMFGKYAIPNLMKYVIGFKILGAVLGLINPQIYNNFFMFNANAILHGQIWRLVTFILSPEISMQSGGMLIDMLFFAIWSYLYYYIGNAIERIWGTFRLNLYFFTGLFATIILAFLYCMFTNDMQSGFMSLDLIFQAMFLTFALMFPDTSFLLYFVIPIKAKWLGYASVAFSFYNTFEFALNRFYLPVILFIAAYGNFLLFYMLTNTSARRAKFFKQHKKDKTIKYKSAVFRTAQPKSIQRHKCVVCGKTELDDQTLTFRFCSKCEGDYEYCSDHLFTHEHQKNTF